MLNRKALLFVAGAAIFALDASAATAQGRRPVSTTRIPVTKEAPGEVVVRVDTVWQYRTDTLQLPPRVDTIVRTNTITRVDTVIRLPPRPRQIGGLYLGIAGGAAFPGADFNDSDHPGWHIEGHVGVDPIGSPLGVRAFVGYSRYSPHDYLDFIKDDAAMLTVGGELKLRAFTTNAFRRRVEFYGLAGGSWNRFKNVLENDDGVLTIGDVGTVNGQFLTVDDDWHNGGAWHLGGGAQAGWGNANVFAEVRYQRLNGVNTHFANVPLVIGVSWYLAR